MSLDRPELFRYGMQLGTVDAVYRDEWEVDVRSVDGSIVRRATVVGPRLPEASTNRRPQWVEYGFYDHMEGQAWARPIARDLSALRANRGDYGLYEEVGHIRVTVSHDNVYEVRNLAADDGKESGAPICRLAIAEKDGVIEFETPDVSIRLRQSDKSLALACAKDWSVHCETAHIVVSDEASIEVGANCDLKVGGELRATVTGGASVTAEQVTVTAPTIGFTGDMTLTGNFTLVGVMVIA